MTVAVVSRLPESFKVATAFLPAPGFWEGRPPTKGFEAALFGRRPDRPNRVPV